MNLMTKSGQTTNYSAHDHLKDLEKYLGKTPDVILVNNSPISSEVLKSYERYNEIKVENDLKNRGDLAKVVEADLVDNKPIELDESDILYRSILRHDSKKVAAALKKLFYA